MNRKEFYNIVKTEGLNKYNIGDSFEIPKVANVVQFTLLYQRQILFVGASRCKSQCKQEQLPSHLPPLAERSKADTCYKLGKFGIRRYI